MARKVIRRRVPQYQTAKVWLCRSRLGKVSVWLGERNKIQYNGVWWERVDYLPPNQWLSMRNPWGGRAAAWLECQFTELFDISIDELPALGECDHVTIEIEKES